MEQSVQATAASRAPGLNALAPIFVGGGLAGLFDLIAAFIVFGWGVPRAIAGGLLGPSAFEGGAGVWILGAALHFFITIAAAAVYFVASLRLPFLRTHPLVCGLFFGIAVFLVMTLIVLPLSALNSAGPFRLEELIQGLLVHMFLVGLPISYSVRYLCK
jgi:hypothetical protein